MAVKTRCQTPDAQYAIRVEPHKLTVVVEHPHLLNLNGRDSRLLERNAHNAIELALAPFYREAT